MPQERGAAPRRSVRFGRGVQPRDWLPIDRDGAALPHLRIAFFRARAAHQRRGLHSGDAISCGGDRRQGQGILRAHVGDRSGTLARFMHRGGGSALAVDPGVLVDRPPSHRNGNQVLVGSSYGRDGDPRFDRDGWHCVAAERSFRCLAAASHGRSESRRRPLLVGQIALCCRAQRGAHPRSCQAASRWKLLPFGSVGPDGQSGGAARVASSDGAMAVPARRCGRRCAGRRADRRRARCGLARCGRRT